MMHKKMNKKKTFTRIDYQAQVASHKKSHKKTNTNQLYTKKDT